MNFNKAKEEFGKALSSIEDRAFWQNKIKDNFGVLEIRAVDFLGHCSDDIDLADLRGMVRDNSGALALAFGLREIRWIMPQRTFNQKQRGTFNNKIRIDYGK